MHRILQRQIEHFFGKDKNIPEDWKEFLDAVSQTYAHFDEDRELLDRSLSLSSEEFFENSRKLEKAKQEVEQIVEERTLQLAEEKSRLLASVENLSLGFAMFDLQGKVLNINQAFKNFLAINTLENLSELNSLLGKDSVLQKLFDKCLNSKQPVNLENFSLGKKYFTFFLTPVILANTNQVIGVVMIIEDFTKEQEIDKAKSEFIILASHQLRTPLTIIKWNSEFLTKQVTENPALFNYIKNIKAIEEGTSRMAALIQALLNVTRVEIGKLAISPELISPEEVSRLSMEELRAQAEIKDLAVKEFYEQGLPQMKADPNLLKIILQNLLTNAVKYTPEKGMISLGVGVDKENILNKPAVVFTVSDTGYGIPFQDQTRIFTKLFRSENIKLVGASGTGLGLYLTKAIVESCGGKIWFKSPVHMSHASSAQGSSFFVALPVDGVPKKEGVTFLPENNSREVLYS